MAHWHWMERLKAALLALFFLAFVATGIAEMVKASPAPKAGPVVKVILAQGHGSGTHLGNGYVLTAAHVPGDAKEVEILLDNGEKQKADVLWVNKTYDIALLRTAKSRGIAVSDLACRTPKSDEPITAKGNPSALEFLTFHGFVGGAAREIGPWKVAVPVDLSLIGGMSGGPTYDANGKLVGVVVGTMMVPTGFSASWVRIGVVVPAETVCMLMGRVA